MGESSNSLIKESEALEKDYLKKMYLCEEFENFVDKQSKKVAGSDKKNYVKIMNELIEVVDSQIEVETEERDRLYQNFRAKESEAYKKITELINSIEISDKKQPGA